MATSWASLAPKAACLGLELVEEWPSTLILLPMITLSLGPLLSFFRFVSVLVIEVVYGLSVVASQTNVLWTESEKTESASACRPSVQNRRRRGTQDQGEQGQWSLVDGACPQFPPFQNALRKIPFWKHHWLSRLASHIDVLLFLGSIFHLLFIKHYFGITFWSG